MRSVGLALAVWWLLVFVVAANRYRGPAPLGLEAPADQFSAARAIATLERVLGDERPHPAGSDANNEVRNRLVEELRHLGLEVEQQRTAFPVTGKPPVPLVNVLARFPQSPREGQPLLLVTHHDSCRVGPGAGDAGSAMAAVLETARALREEPLTRPVYLLFTDGEELGLLGARRFVETHSLMQARPFVLNFDARGDTGASLMYETQQGNADWVAFAATHLPRPMGTGSAFVTVYERMPNGSDFTIFRRAGLPGANFAIIGSVHRYHTPLDTIANLDPRSVQHQGENALALTRALLKEGFPEFAGRPDAVFFDVAGLTVVRYPVWFAQVVAVLALLVHLRASLRLMARKDGWRVVLWILVTVVLTVATAVGTGWVLMEPGKRALAADEMAVAWQIGTTVALWIGAVAISWGFAAWCLGRQPADAVASHVWLGWSVLAAASAFALPGLSYFVTWPALAAACASPIRRPEIRFAMPVAITGLVLVPSLYLVPIALRLVAAPVLLPIFGLALTVWWPFCAARPETGEAKIPATEEVA